MIPFTADPTHLIVQSFGQKTFKGSQRTFAHLLDTQEKLSKAHPGATIYVIQPCYNDTVAASAGTHDYDATLDVKIVGLDWWAAQRFLRAHGWACWYRHTGAWANSGNWHIHMTSLGATAAGCKVGEFIDGGISLFGHLVASSQVADYYAHAFGLEGEHTPDSDTSWFPTNIKSTIFNYAAWLRQQEDNMPFSDWPQKDQDALAKAVADKVVPQLLNTTVGPSTDLVPVRQALYRASKIPALLTTAVTTIKRSVSPKG